MSTTDLDTLAAIFTHRPALHPPFLRRVLLAHGGDLPRACDYLLSLPETGPLPPFASPQDHLHACESHEPFLPDLPRNAAHSRSLAPVQYEHLQPAVIDLSDPDQATRILENLKDIVVPALKSELAGLCFPDLCGEADRINYSLAGLRLSSITLDPAHISVEVTGSQQVSVIATNAALEVDVAQWAYRLRFPPIRDAGRAHFSFSGVKADILLAMESRHSSPAIVACNCTIAGTISFRANDARLSWLYNTLAPVLKNVVRPSLEATLTSAIRSGLELQLEDWSSWTTF